MTQNKKNPGQNPSAIKKQKHPHPKAPVLIKLIEDRSKQHPFEFDGQIWAAEPKELWCDQ